MGDSVLKYWLDLHRSGYDNKHERKWNSELVRNVEHAFNVHAALHEQLCDHRIVIYSDVVARRKDNRKRQVSDATHIVYVW